MQFSSLSRYSSAILVISAALAAAHCGSSGNKPGDTRAAGDANGALTAANGNDAANANNASVANGNGATTSSITVAGHKVGTSHAVYFSIPSPSVGTSNQTVIRLTDDPNSCTPKREFTAGMSQVDMVFNTTDALAAGDFTVVSLGAPTPGIGQAAPKNPASFLAQLFDTPDHDVICDSDITKCAGNGTDGSITLSNIAGANGPISGSFNVKVGPQADTVTGKFQATYCSGPSTAPTPTPAP